MVDSKIDPKTHINILDPLLAALKKREGVLLLKRLTIVLDAESEKGFGLVRSHSSIVLSRIHLAPQTNSNAPVFTPYDILSLLPTTPATFSAACLTHSLPSPLTAHIIVLPTSAPRLPFNLKHTLVRTAIKNGAVFELSLAGALRERDGKGKDEGERRNWWAAGREVTRVSKGKGMIVSGGADALTELRAPKDAENLWVNLLHA